MAPAPGPNLTPMLSLRRRVGLAHQGAILGVLALAAFAAYLALVYVVHAQLDTALLTLAQTEARLQADGASPGGTAEHPRVAPVRVHEAATDASAPGSAPMSAPVSAPMSAPMSFMRLDRLVQIIDANGAVLARSANLGAQRLPVSAALLARLGAGHTVYETLHDFAEEPTRLVTLPLRVGARAPWRAVQVAGSLDDVQNVLNVAAGLLLVMSAVLWLSVGAAGAVLMRRVFGAIDDVVQKAHRIGEEDLSQRLPHPGTADETGRLVDTLNEMLARIERGFDVQRRFTADASHELRSPLSRLRCELELALRRPREPADYIETLRSGLEEVERLTLLVEELLTLARIDAGQEQGRAERVELNRLVEDALARMRPIAQARRVELRLDAPEPVRAKVAPGAASLVLDNLLDNAIKFSPGGSCITVQLGVDGAHAVLRVRDAGPGVRGEELERIFERFYRGPSARPGSTPGMGLGLALSQALVRANGGSISAANGTPRGAVFEVRLPGVG